MTKCPICGRERHIDNIEAFFYSPLLFLLEAQEILDLRKELEEIKALEDPHEILQRLQKTLDYLKTKLHAYKKMEEDLKTLMKLQKISEAIEE